MDLLPLNTLTLSLTGLSTIGKTFFKHYMHRKKISSETCVLSLLTPLDLSPRGSRPRRQTIPFADAVLLLRPQ